MSIHSPRAPTVVLRRFTVASLANLAGFAGAIAHPAVPLVLGRIDARVAAVSGVLARVVAHLFRGTAPNCKGVDRL